MKLICGVGINDADYPLYKTIKTDNGGRKVVWYCPYYRRWKNMIQRVYSEKYTDRWPTYKECSICTPWLTFSNFKSWMEKQDWEGKVLDKDILIKGNKLYSPDTCVFVSHIVNCFNLDCGKDVGIIQNIKSNLFAASCSNPFTGKQERLGSFKTPQESKNAWRKRKDEIACQLADMQKDERVANALRKMFKE